MFRAFFALVMIVTLTLACLPSPALASPATTRLGAPSLLTEMSELAGRLLAQIELVAAKISATIDPNGTPTPPPKPEPLATEPTTAGGRASLDRG